MGDELNTGGENGGQTPAGRQPASTGQRLDQFLSGAQHLGSVARQKAREAADAAAPRLKDLREAASAHGNRMLQGVPQGSLVDRVRAFVGSGGHTRKGLLIVGCGMGALALISCLILPLTLLMSHAPVMPDIQGPYGLNVMNVQAGMTEAQVDKLLSAPSTVVKQPDGSLVKMWTRTGLGPLHVTFVDGKVATKTEDELPGPDQANLAKVQSGMTEAQMSARSGPSQADLDQVKVGMPMSELYDLLGQASGMEMRPSGPPIYTWTPSATGGRPIHITFADGKVMTKVVDEAGTAASGVDPTAKLLEAMQGKWQSDTSNDTPTFTISGNTRHWNEPFRTPAENGSPAVTIYLPDQTFVVSATHHPAWIDEPTDQDFKGRPGISQGIIEIIGDNMKMLTSDPSAERPKSFDDFTAPNDPAWSEEFRATVKKDFSSKTEAYHRVQ